MKRIAPALLVVLIFSGCAARSPNERATLDYVALSSGITASANSTSGLLNQEVVTPQQAMMLWSSLSAAQRLLNQSQAEASAGKTELALTLFNMALDAAGQVETVLANTQAQKELADDEIGKAESGGSGAEAGNAAGAEGP